MTNYIQQLMQSQQSSLQYFFQHFNHQEVAQLVDELSQAKGMVFVSGVGKSGFIAQKIAATLVSMGIKAMFMPPMNALHGDLGIVDEEDVFILLSKSGESEELLNLVPFLRNKGAEITAVVSVKNSRLAKACDHIIYLPLDKELCTHNIVPTTSTEIQLIFGDLLAVALMQNKKIALADFATNHPAGKIGERLTLKVEDLMVHGDDLPLAKPDLLVSEALPTFTEKKCGCLLVVDEQMQLVGIFTDGDLRRALQSHGADILNQPLKSLLKKAAHTIAPHKMAWEAMQQMEADQKRPFTVLPVVDDHQKLKGLIKMHDLLQSGLR